MTISSETTDSVTERNDATPEIGKVLYVNNLPIFYDDDDDETNEDYSELIKRNETIKEKLKSMMTRQHVKLETPKKKKAEEEENRKRKIFIAETPEEKLMMMKQRCIEKMNGTNEVVLQTPIEKMKRRKVNSKTAERLRKIIAVQTLKPRASTRLSFSQTSSNGCSSQISQASLTSTTT